MRFVLEIEAEKSGGAARRRQRCWLANDVDGLLWKIIGGSVGRASASGCRGSVIFGEPNSKLWKSGCAIPPTRFKCSRIEKMGPYLYYSALFYVFPPKKYLCCS
jgi:hypothetical protein